MKSIIKVLIAMAGLMAACSVMAAGRATAASSVVAASSVKAASSVMAIEEMPDLAKKLKCAGCHSIDKKVVGPAWRDVAKKYTGSGVTRYTYNDKEYPLIEGLVMKVSKGGSGEWGTTPMPANDAAGIRQAEITELVKFVQSLKTN